MSEHVYVSHRYGHHGGSIKVLSRGGAKYRSTEGAMIDKARYNETRFSGEKNTAYNEEGQVIDGGYRAAYLHTRNGAESVAKTNLTGRSRGKAYVYDSTINPGAGRLIDEKAHQIAQRYVEELRERGYRVEGYQYTIHQGTEHTHIHAMYASHKTIQRADLGGVSKSMRQYLDTTQEKEVNYDQNHEVESHISRSIRG